MNQQKFYMELEQLAKLGYLEEEQLDRIRQEYLGSQKGMSRTFLAFALIGVIFIGAGILSMFAFNWSMFPRGIKAAIAFLPLLGVQFMLYQKLQQGASDTWIKSLTLALGIAFLCTLGLVFQAYQLSYSLISVLTAGFLLMLPVIYLLDGYYLAILYLAGICFLGHESQASFLVLLLFPYYRNRICRRENCWQLSLCFFFWFLYIAARYLPDAAFFVWIMVLSIYITIEEPLLYRKLARCLLYGLLFLKALYYHAFFEVAQACTDITSMPWQESIGLLGPVFLVFLAVIAVRLCLAYKKQGKTAALDRILACAAGFLLAADVYFCRDAGNSVYEILVNTGLIAFSLFRLLTGGRQKNLSSVRRYTAAIVLYIVLKISSGEYPLLAKGVFFLIAGAVFLTVNYIMTSKLKGGKTDETIPE